MKVKESHAGIRVQIVQWDCPIADQFMAILSASNGHWNTTGDFYALYLEAEPSVKGYQKRLKDLWDK